MGVVIWGPWPDTERANLSVWQIAQRYSVTTRTVYRWIEDGLPHERGLDGSPRFNAARCDQWRAARDEERTANG